MALIHAYKERGFTRNIVILDADDDVIVPTASDKVRITIGREGETPKLTFATGSPTANGSRISTGATNIVRVDADDLDFDPGVYTFSVEFFDSSDSSEWKMVEKQVFSLEGVV